MFKALKEKVSNEYEKARVNIQSQALNLVNNGSINTSIDKIDESKPPNNELQQSSQKESLLKTDFNKSQQQQSDRGFSLVDLDEENDQYIPPPASKKEAQTSSGNEDSFFKSKFSNFVSNISNFVPQSDIESEYESESANKNLDNVSKEQLMELCYRLKERGRKYRERWTEVVKAYRETVDEKDKLKNVLSETQDKAIRRMNELKEQCGLEQEAKRHLEENLRVVIEEKEEQIKVLQKQFELLNVDKILIEPSSQDRQENVSKTERLESLLAKCNESLTSHKEKLDVVMKENEQLFKYKDESMKLREEIEQMRKLKDSANDSFVEAKQKLHDELESRKIIIKELKDQLDKRNVEVKQKNSELKTKNENLKNLNEKLVKIEQNFEKEKLNLIEEHQNKEAKEIEKLKNEHETVLESIQKDLQSRLDDLIEKNQKLEESQLQQSSSDELQQTNEELKRLTQLVEEKNLEKSTLEQQLIAEENKCKDLENLVAYLNSKVSELEAVREKLETSEKARQEEEIQLRQTKLEMENLNKQIQEKDDLMVQLKDQAEKSEKQFLDELNSLKNQLESTDICKDSDVQAMRARIQKFDEEITEKNNRIKQIEENIAERDSKIQVLNQKYCDLEKEFEIYKKNSNEECLSLKSSLEKAQKATEVSKKLIQKLRDDNSKQQATIEALKDVEKVIEKLNGNIESVAIQMMEFKTRLVEIFSAEFSENEKANIIAIEPKRLLETVESTYRKLIEENVSLKEKAIQIDETLLQSNKQLENKLKELLKQIENLQSDKDHLIRELERFEDLESECCDLKLALEQKSSQIEEMKDRETHLNGELSRFKNEIKDYKKELKAKTNQIQEQNQFLVQIQESLAKKEKELEELRKEILDKNAITNADNEEIKNHCQKLEQELQCLNEKDEKLQAEINELGKQNSLYLAEIAKIKSNAKEILESKQKLKETLHKSEAQLKNCRKDLQQSQDENKEQQRKLDDLINNLNASCQDKIVLEEKVAALKESLGRKELDEKESKTIIKDLESKIDKFNKENASSNDRIKSVQDELKKNQERCLKLEEKLSLHDVCEQELRTEIIALEEKYKSSMKNEKEIKEELRINEEVANSLKDQLHKLKAENKELKTCMDSMKHKHEATIESLYKQLEIRESQLDESLMNSNSRQNSTNQDLIKARSEITKLKSQIEELCSANQDLETKLKSLTETNNEQLNKLVKQHESQMEVLQSKLEEKKQEITEKMDQFDNIENRLLEKHKSTIQQLQSEITEKNTALEEVHDYYQQRLKAKDNELKHLHEQFSSTDRNNYQINALQNSILQYHEENLRLKELVSMQQDSRTTTNNNDLSSSNSQRNRTDSDMENCAILGVHLPQPTEYEYLRNILYEFMIGREPVTLAKVIAAVMRFNNDQTDQIIRRQEFINSSSNKSTPK